VLAGPLPFAFAVVGALTTMDGAAIGARRTTCRLPRSPDPHQRAAVLFGPVDLGKKAWYEWSEREIDGACGYGGDMFAETAQRAAKTVKLSKNNSWQSLPYSLSRRLELHPPANLRVMQDANGKFAGWSSPRVARFQAFDDGSRIMDVADVREDQEERIPSG
jgi:hypothetical protein